MQLKFSVLALSLFVVVSESRRYSYLTETMPYFAKSIPDVLSELNVLSHRHVAWLFIQCIQDQDPFWIGQRLADVGMKQVQFI